MTISTFVQTTFNLQSSLIYIVKLYQMLVAKVKEVWNDTRVNEINSFFGEVM